MDGVYSCLMYSNLFWNASKKKMDGGWMDECIVTWMDGWNNGWMDM